MSDRRVSTVLVNWNNFEDSAECLDSLERCTYPNHEVIVVDNGSDGDDAELLRRGYGDRIRLIENARNLGFAAGCNVGISDALARGSDYVLLLNNDTVVTPEFASELIGAVEARSDVGVAGGKILCHELPGIIWSAGGTIDYRNGKTPMRGGSQRDDGRFDEEAEVDWVCSCFMLVPRAVWESVGLFDERFFFGWEDVDLCVRASRSGFRILYVPRAVVSHKEFGERKKDRLRGMPLYYATRGHLIFIGKHLTKRQLAGAGLRYVREFPRAVWDYSRITGQWTGPVYMLRALFDAVRTSRRGR